MREVSTRVQRPVTLRKMKEGPAARPRIFRNRFSPIALRWASSLLLSCDAPRHGIDLFGRDSLLLGRLLTTLGTFMECVDQVGWKTSRVCVFVVCAYVCVFVCLYIDSLRLGRQLTMLGTFMGCVDHMHVTERLTQSLLTTPSCTQLSPLLTACARNSVPY